MEQYISKSALVAEIDKLIEDAFRNNKFYVTTDQLNLLKHRINTLEVKEVDLEKESLTWEDMLIIHRCIKYAMNYHLSAFQTVGGQQKVYEDVLRRFKAQKGE